MNQRNSLLGKWVCVLIGLSLSAAVAAGVSGPSANSPTLDQWLSTAVSDALRDGLTPIDFPALMAVGEFRQSLSAWPTATTLLDRLASARPMDPLMADEVRLLRAELAVDEGRPEAARQAFVRAGGLTRWWASPSRPFEELGDFAGLATLPPEDTPWRATPGTDPAGWVQIQGLAWPARRQMLSLATTIHSDRQQPVALRIGAAQVARIWLNGEQLLTTEFPLRSSEDQVAVGGWLGEGRNSLVVAVASESSDWWLRVRVTEPDGSPMTGVRELNEPPTSAPAVDRGSPSIRTLGTEIRDGVDAGQPGSRLALAALLVDRNADPVGSGTAVHACRAARDDDPVLARLLEWMETTEPAGERDLLSAALDAGAPAFPVRSDLARWYHQRDLDHRAMEVLEPGGDEPAIQAMRAALNIDRWGPVMVDDLRRQADRHPESVDLLLLLAQRSAEFGRQALLDTALDRLTDLAPGLPRVEALRVDQAARCGDARRLIAVHQASLDRDPNQPNLRIRLSRLFVSEGRLDSARAVVEEGLARCPDHIELAMEKAYLDHHSGHPEAAALGAREILRRRPQNQTARDLLELLGQADEPRTPLVQSDRLWRLAEAAGHLPGPNVALLHHTTVRFLPGNLKEETVHRAWLVRAPDASKNLERYRLPYVPEVQRIKVLQARILREDGTEISARRFDSPRLSDPELNIYYDTRLRIFAFDELQPGDLIEVATVVTETAESNETGAYEGGLIRLGSGAPTLETRIVFEGPEKSLPTWELANLQGEPEVSTGADGVRRLTWTFHDLEALSRDAPKGPELLLRPHLVYSNHPDWGDLADWYRRHVSTRIRPSRQIEDLAERLTGSVTNRGEKIARIYAFVTNEIRYVGLEFGEHRFRPFSADWVLNHRIGDCKDTAGLLVALFTSIDIPARMAMIRTSDLGPVSADTALLEDFNHAIAYLPEDDLWLDGTAAGHNAFPPPGIDQNAFALVIDGPSSRPTTTPNPGAGRFEATYTLVKADDGTFELTLRTADTGEAATQRRSRFGGSRNPHLFSRWIQAQFPGARLVGEPDLDLNPAKQTATMDIRAVIDRSVFLAGDGLKTYPGSFNLDTELMPSGSRSTPLLVPVRPELHWTIDLRPRPPALPEPVSLDTPFGSLKIEVERHETGLRVNGRFRLTPGLVEAADTTALRSFLVQCRKSLEAPLEVP